MKIEKVKTCGECRRYFECESVFEDYVACEDFMPSTKTTVFNHITASPEALAPKFVYYTVNRDQFGTYYWYCSALIPGEKWSEEAEAITATLARLNTPTEINTEREE